MLEVHWLPSASERQEINIRFRVPVTFRRTSDQLLRGPFPIRVSAFIDLEPLAISSLEIGAISVARGHQSRDGTQVIARPLWSMNDIKVSRAVGGRTGAEGRTFVQKKVISLPALTSKMSCVPSSPPLLQAISGLEMSVTGPSLGTLRTTRVGTGLAYLCGSETLFH